MSVSRSTTARKTAGGQEITTYDSLDHSLAQTRNNVYIAVKSWASYRALALLFRDLGASADQKRSEDLAVKVAGVVADQAVDGVLPAIFEKGNPGYDSRILPAVEGCAYPLYFVKTKWAKKTLDQVFGSAVREAHVRCSWKRTPGSCCWIRNAAICLRRWRNQALLDQQQLVDEQDFHLHARDAQGLPSGSRIRASRTSSARPTRLTSNGRRKAAPTGRAAIRSCRAKARPAATIRASSPARCGWIKRSGAPPSSLR